MNVFLRRLLDVIASFAGLIVLIPVLLAISLLILLRDGRPVLFRQARVGKGGKPFWILKFRTMAANSEGLAITASDDNRITPVGRHLRKLKLDELPQLFNILNGDMSLIGPRPETPQFVIYENMLWQQVLQVRPGLTDPTTLLYRNEGEILAQAHDPEAFYRGAILPAKLQLSAQYLKTRSWHSDMKILAFTALYSFFPKTFNSERVAKSFDLPEGSLYQRGAVRMTSRPPFSNDSQEQEGLAAGTVKR